MIPCKDEFVEDPDHFNLPHQPEASASRHTNPKRKRAPHFVSSVLFVVKLNSSLLTPDT